MLRKIVLVILFGAFSIITCAQELRSMFNKAFLAPPDTNYIRHLNDYFGLQMSAFQTNSSFDIYDTRRSSKASYNCIDRSPSVSLGISYKWLALKLGLSMGIFDSSKDGKKFDLSTQLHFPAITVKLQGNRYTGYELDNLRDSLQKMSIYRRPDIVTKVMRVSADYYFDYQRYSRKAFTSQGEWQRKTGGSVLAGVVWNRNVMRGDSAFVTSKVQDSLSLRDFPVNKITNMFIGGSGGYALTCVKNEKWFFNFQFVVGVGYNNSCLQYIGTPQRNENSAVVFAQGEMGAGYNSNNWFFNISANLFVSDSPMGVERVNVNTESRLMQFTIAYRIKMEKDYEVTELIQEKWGEWRRKR